MKRKDLSDEILLKVYDSAIAEYRFNVQLSWDRNKFFLTLISAIIASGVGFIKVAEESALAAAFLCTLFMISIGIALFAIETLWSGKRYIREANYKKTLIERELGLLEIINGFSSPKSNLSISVTSGQQNYGMMLMNENVSSKISSKSITDNLFKIYCGMIIIEIIGCIVSAILMGGELSSVAPVAPPAANTPSTHG